MDIESFQTWWKLFFQRLFCSSWLRSTHRSSKKQKAHSNNANRPVLDPCLQYYRKDVFCLVALSKPEVWPRSLWNTVTSVGEIISLMLLLYQLSAGIGSVFLISNNLPFLSPQLIWSFYWCNCCFLSYSNFQGHWKVNLQVKSLLCYYLVTSICESHLNKTTHLFTLLTKGKKAKIFQPVNHQPLDWIWAGSTHTKCSLFYACLEISSPKPDTLKTS